MTALCPELLLRIFEEFTAYKTAYFFISKVVQYENTAKLIKGNYFSYDNTLYGDL